MTILDLYAARNSPSVGLIESFVERYTSDSSSSVGLTTSIELMMISSDTSVPTPLVADHEWTCIYVNSLEQAIAVGLEGKHLFTLYFRPSGDFSRCSLSFGKLGCVSFGVGVGGDLAIRSVQPLLKSLIELTGSHHGWITVDSPPRLDLKEPWMDPLSIARFDVGIDGLQTTYLR